MIPEIKSLFGLRDAEAVSQFIFVSFRSKARNLGFNKFSTLRFLAEPVLSQILQSLRSFKMTERRVRNDIFSNYDTVSPRGSHVIRGLAWAAQKSQRVGLNHRPTDYESVALPLSYAGCVFNLC